MFAKIQFDADGIPRSEEFGDVYHSIHGGYEQSLHVFVGGNQLEERWGSTQVSSFVIFETGFGLGVNFLTTVATWLQTKRASNSQLRFVSVEKFLPKPEDLDRVWNELITKLKASPALQDQLIGVKEKLLREWPLQSDGEYRFNLFEGVQLHLLVEEVEVALTRAAKDYAQQVDAIYLDGFNPAKNPAMWTQSVCHGVAHLAKPQATLATWAVTGFVRRQLEEAGFTLEKKPGFANKREMLFGVKI
mgnify:CR=1 FL=1